MSCRLLIIGPDLTIHGIGGVTIHVQRLKDSLEKNKFGYEFKDYKCTKLWTLTREISKSKIVHFHISNPIYQFVLVCCSKLMGKKILMTVHGSYGRFGAVKNWMVRSAIRMATVPIVINEMSYQKCKIFNKQTRLIPAFIPPQKEERLQAEIVNLVNRLHDEGKKIVSTNAYNISFDKNGNDTYGIGFLLDYFKQSDNMALVVSDPSGNYHKQYADLQSSSVFFIDYSHPYFELLKHVDYFVRNTSTDGDALSVKEALYLGVPTLCSDVVDRPKGVSTFKYSDSVSFEKCLLTSNKAEVEIEDGAEKLLKLYKELEKQSNI